MSFCCTISARGPRPCPSRAAPGAMAGESAGDAGGCCGARRGQIIGRRGGTAWMTKRRDVRGMLLIRLRRRTRRHRLLRTARGMLCGQSCGSDSLAPPRRAYPNCSDNGSRWSARRPLHNALADSRRSVRHLAVCKRWPSRASAPFARACGHFPRAFHKASGTTSTSSSYSMVTCRLMLLSAIGKVTPRRVRMLLGVKRGRSRSRGNALRRRPRDDGRKVEVRCEFYQGQKCWAVELMVMSKWEPNSRERSPRNS
ncbi:hypothetical protein CDCA_CDCA01G0124 [Cyanidium caldarium]|uniref:Uncharacterized protein n=1 Tax=Cyanidium caldarium TaxID=2771 RepID=A0AAV9IPC4_CYACA|nr:hypothetical protein CDCA_CDCA01G0124 [Cyanidium caldarium]